ncbi:hypothetical protein GCM10010256_14680 [Streptomyces coeruleorubidus]|nr:hypothetical protein GCM10010256_14680 [Streptomyces coeruleorubidus]
MPTTTTSPPAPAHSRRVETGAACSLPSLMRPVYDASGGGATPAPPTVEPEIRQ